MFTNRAMIAASAALALTSALAVGGLTAGATADIAAPVTAISMSSGVHPTHPWGPQCWGPDGTWNPDCGPAHEPGMGHGQWGPGMGHGHGGPGMGHGHWGAMGW
ncbi:hypothetical protein MCHIJ_52180 [Mycolicibacterium chitae]|uniref:Uncharacterized protein n=1 Tax=Mycolicibacterium chitae TaxID=1792 RepID=A0A448IAH0_MYCCI|nr:hypothetical protein [Mycolicibacterium chitae]MCV7107780.1 hypothetical protein [Mycolicibacterium chitae]BBZ05781.1 hypothetical protein MCHIJ_52180 [Mycolicibacterium chitae]VEG49391.1 Uncharacterised protein [Mycolicibacterium chitae]